jgi:cytochrome oxidase Cu insertion factor (SCO1/SenC/PrrC family)
VVIVTRKRITKPGPADCEFVAITCTPDKTTAEFFETHAEAYDAAWTNLLPSISTFVASITEQAQHAQRGTAKHVAFVVEVDDELMKALRWSCRKQIRGRADVQRELQSLLTQSIKAIVEDYKLAEDTTHSLPKAEVGERDG